MQWFRSIAVLQHALILFHAAREARRVLHIWMDLTEEPFASEIRPMCISAVFLSAFEPVALSFVTPLSTCFRGHFESMKGRFSTHPNFRDGFAHHKTPHSQGER